MKTPMKTPKTLDFSVLPEDLRWNWSVFVAVSEAARIRFCRDYANSNFDPVENHMDWCDAFDDASRTWCAANPHDEIWASGRWPEGASIWPGQAAIDRALSIMNE